MSKREYEKDIPCGLCGAKKKQVAIAAPANSAAAAQIKEWGVRLVRCGVCGFEQYDPRLKEKFVLENFFRSPDAKASAELFAAKGVHFGEPAPKQMEINATIHGAAYDRLAQRYAQSSGGKAPASLFEIGDSGGAFLKAARDRAAASNAKLEVAGCDANVFAADIATKQLGIDVEGGSFGDFKVKGKQKRHFDIVVNGLLSASYDPLGDLKKMGELAKRGGLLSIRTSVADNDAAGVYLHPVFGQARFTRATLKDAIGRTGWKLAEFDDKSEWQLSLVTVTAING